MIDLETFLTDSNEWGKRNAWVRFRNGEIYMRRAPRQHMVDGRYIETELDIANVRFEPEGQGGFTSLLDTLEPRYGIYVENVLNPRLHDWLKRRGYSQVGTQYPYCMVKDVVGQCC